MRYPREKKRENDRSLLQEERKEGKKKGRKEGRKGARGCWVIEIKTMPMEQSDIDDDVVVDSYMVVEVIVAMAVATQAICG